MSRYIKYIIILVLINTLGIIFLYIENKTETYTKNLFYMDTYINIKINSTKNKAELGFKEALELFRVYHNLTDRYNEESELYLLNHTKGELEVDEKLYKLISYAYDFYEMSNGLFNINMGPVIDIWKYYRESQIGIPTKTELNLDTNIKNIRLLNNNTILNDGASIDLGGVVKGYVTKLIGEKFKQLKINDYIINAGGNVLVGKKNKGVYKIGIESPLKNKEIYKIVNGNNISVVTSGSYERFYEYEGKRYHHIINPKTNYPSDYMQSVTVVSKDSALADVLSTVLFLMPVQEGKKYLEQFKDTEAIWFIDENTIIQSKGFEKYE